MFFSPCIFFSAREKNPKIARENNGLIVKKVSVKIKSCPWTFLLDVIFQKCSQTKPINSNFNP